MKMKKINVKIRGIEFLADVAEKFEEWRLGLGFRNTLDKNSCLLMKFPDNRIIPIGMYNMKFPIDVLWLNDKKEVMFIEEEVPIYSSNQQITKLKGYTAKYVIELNSGTVKYLKIKVKDKIDFD